MVSALIEWLKFQWPPALKPGQLPASSVDGETSSAKGVSKAALKALQQRRPDQKHFYSQTFSSLGGNLMCTRNQGTEQKEQSQMCPGR